MTQLKLKHAIAMNTHARGFTLVELMIAITLGLLLVAGVAYTYLGNRATYRQQDNLARMQESARHAFEVLDFDIRMTGFTGCTASTTANTVNPSSLIDGNLFTQALTGYEEGVSTFPSTITASRLRGDALSVLRANTDTEYIVTSHVPASATIGISTPNDLQQGEILVITDCERASTFQKSNPISGSTNPPVNHDTGNNISPGNCTQGFGPDPITGLPQCGNPTGVPYSYAPKVAPPSNSRIYRLSGNTYYIGTNAAGQPALFRQRLTQSGGIAATVPEELVEGVEDMQITYGVDRSTPADNIVDIYVPANLVSAAATPGVTFSDKWRRALSVQIVLLLRSTDNNVTTVSQPYTFNGASVTDRRLRKMFTTTIAIRNRL